MRRRLPITLSILQSDLKGARGVNDWGVTERRVHLTITMESVHYGYDTRFCLLYTFMTSRYPKQRDEINSE